MKYRGVFKKRGKTVRSTDVVRYYVPAVKKKREIHTKASCQEKRTCVFLKLLRAGTSGRL